MHEVYIDYKNEKKVFVESYVDQEIYTAIFNNLIGKYQNIVLNKKIKINFVAAGKLIDEGTVKNKLTQMVKEIEAEIDKEKISVFTNEIIGIGNCGAVKAEVKRLRKHSVPNVFGIIDWDCSDNGVDNIYQMIKGEAYALDNIVFNPYLFIYYLCTQYSDAKLISFLVEHFDADTYGKDIDITTYLISSFEKELNNHILKKNKKFDFIDDSNKVEITFIDSNKFSFSNWYVSSNGHLLEREIVEWLPFLKVFKKEGNLKIDVIKKVLPSKKCNFLSKTIDDIFYIIQSKN